MKTPRPLQQRITSLSRVRSAFARYSVILFCFVLAGCLGVVISWGAERSRPAGIDQEPQGNPPIIKDNTVVFFGISQSDFDALLKQKPELSDSIEELSDFYHYAMMAETRLTSLGYTVLYGSWHSVKVQMDDEKIKTMVFDPTDLRAILMKAKGKDPELIMRSRFTPDFSSISDVISKYFGIKID